MSTEYFNVIMVILTILGIAGGLWQWHKSNQIRRADFVNQILNKLRFNEEVSNVVQRIEYDDKWYNAKFHGGVDETKFDRTFSVINHICYLKRKNLINDEDFSILDYEVTRIILTKQVQEYLWNLYHFSVMQGVPTSFRYMISYGIDENLIGENFYDENCKEYNKYLPF